MRYAFTIILALSLTMSMVSCKSLFNPPPPKPKKNPDGTPHTLTPEEQQDQLVKARTLLVRGEYEEARKALKPLMASNLLSDDVLKLDQAITEKQLSDHYDRIQEETRLKVLEDIDQRLVLPENYGKTFTITGKTLNPELSPGPMEKVVRRKVSMDLHQAGLEQVVLALSKITGLNIVADNALDSERTLTVNVKDAPLHELLSYIARNMEVAFHLGDNIVWVTESEMDSSSDKGPKLEIQIYKLNFGCVPVLGASSKISPDSTGIGNSSEFEQVFAGGDTASELSDALNNFLDQSPEGAYYRIYRNRNLLVMKNTRENLRVTERLLKEFDRPIHQVLIEARFLTISNKDLYELGFHLPELGPKEKGEDAFVQEVSNNLLPNFPKKNGTLAISGIINRIKYKAVLNAMNEKSSTKTLSAPRITVLNNHPAMIRRGDTIRYYEEYELETIPNEMGVAVSQPVPTGDVQELDLGINFYVKPTIGHDSRHIMMALKPFISEFRGWEEFETAKLPQTNENNLETSVIVKSGETVVLGGMILDTREDDKSGVPILSDIPFIGELFGDKKRERSPLHLIVFVTATVVDSSGNFLVVGEEDADKVRAR